MGELLNHYGKLLRRVLPLKTTHFRELPHAVADLSRLLTEERRDMSRPYWSNPRFLSAYAWYFLPWNLYRLCCFLPNLELSLKDHDIVLDLGSGPLTLPQALWISRPDLRSVRLTFVCSDTAAQPLELGRALFNALTATEYSDPASVPWKIRIVRAGLEQALKEAGRKPGRPSPSPVQKNDKPTEQVHGAALILAGNILNELKPPRSMAMDLHIRALCWRLTRALAMGGQAILIEPGNRLGGKILSLLRKNALELGLSALAPCPHQQSCPMLERHCTSWCHFGLDVRPAPDWLQELSALAGLDKNRASLSALMLQRPKDLVTLMPETEFMAIGQEEDADTDENANQYTSKKGNASVACTVKTGHTPARNMEKTMRVRVLSDAFNVPTLKGRCRYACADEGLVLLEDAEHVSEGALAKARPAMPQRRDPKTGAAIFTVIR